MTSTLLSILAGILPEEIFVLGTTEALRKGRFRSQKLFSVWTFVRMGSSMTQGSLPGQFLLALAIPAGSWRLPFCPFLGSSGITFETDSHSLALLLWGRIQALSLSTIYHVFYRHVLVTVSAVSLALPAFLSSVNTVLPLDTLPTQNFLFNLLFQAGVPFKWNRYA